VFFFCCVNITVQCTKKKHTLEFNNLQINYNLIYNSSTTQFTIQVQPNSQLQSTKEETTFDLEAKMTVVLVSSFRLLVTIVNPVSLLRWKNHPWVELKACEQ
jgi:hypothetical protein